MFISCLAECELRLQNIRFLFMLVCQRMWAASSNARSGASVKMEDWEWTLQNTHVIQKLARDNPLVFEYPRIRCFPT